ncbi:MAG TPA: hypothetical protein VI818_04770 [Candidatus Thermoplasmatota archaeon]|nr:hypothetical protein [Candidatus Thermoplasmatota archaeon]
MSQPTPGPVIPDLGCEGHHCSPGLSCRAMAQPIRGMSGVMYCMCQ